MEVFGSAVPSKEVVLRVLNNLFTPEKSKKPLVAAFYATDACNGQCEFCSQKESVEEAKGGSERTDIETQKRILAAIRADVPNIYLMGGEPSIHPHLEELLIECENLQFDTIGVNTNAVIFRTEIPEHANMLIVSLFSTDPLVVGRKLFPNLDEDRQTKLGMRVIENIKKYAKEHDSEKTVMVVNKVVTGEEGDIKGVFDLIAFCREVGIRINIAPAVLPDNRPDPRLVNNKAWMFLIDYLLKNMDVVVCSKEYLKIIKTFEHFDCTPNVVPAVRHNGDIDVPCPNVDSPKTVNLLEVGGVHNALQKGREEFGDFDPSKSCREQCHKACYVEARNLGNVTFVFEALRQIFGKRLNGIVGGQNYSYIDLLKEFCTEDMHDYDSAIGEYIEPIRRKNELFAKLIDELSEDDLVEMKEYLAELWDAFDLIWRFTPGGLKGFFLATDIANQILTRPFTPVFRGIKKVTGISLIGDNCGARAMNRIAKYVKIIDMGLSKRTREKAA